MASYAPNYRARTVTLPVTLGRINLAHSLASQTLTRGGERVWSTAIERFHLRDYCDAIERIRHFGEQVDKIRW